MRYSSLGLITWQRHYNTKPTELAHSQKNLTYAIIEQLATANCTGLVSPLSLLRGILSGIGKGGDHGQKIRDQILVIMHKHQIKRRENSFYEQWHQKLHNNTTPDDIGICEAAIVFNETNDLTQFWEVLTKHNISRERLASFERPITIEPLYAPHLVPDLKDYLELLKSVHQSVDLQMSVEHAQHLFSEGLAGAIHAVMEHLQHWDKLEQLRRTISARNLLKPLLSRGNRHELREFLYVDLALESYSRTLVEQIIHLDVGLQHSFSELFLLLEGVKMHMRDEGLEAATADLKEFYAAYNRTYESTKEHALILKSGVDRLSVVIGNFVDEYMGLIQAKAKHLGTQFGVDQFYIEGFAEELVRGTPVAMLALLVKRLNHTLRSVAGLKPWQIISPRTDIQGLLVLVETLSEVAYVKYPQPTILIAQKVSGDEEIAQGVVAVISKTDLDTLAHVSVRARNSRTFLAVCYEDAELAAAKLLAGQWVTVQQRTEGLAIVGAVRPQGALEAVNGHRQRHIPEPEQMNEVIVLMQDFNVKNVGAKAQNSGVLRRTLPRNVKVPESVALPYGCFEHFLGLPINVGAAEKLRGLLKELEGVTDHTAKDLLETMRTTAKSLEATETQKEQLRIGLRTAGLGDNAWDEAWAAIKAVWASKFNERAYLGTLKAGIPLSGIVMSVLCQPIVEGDYAFVLHTRNPFSGDSNGIYGEIVRGLGETLVGAYEGKALAFTVARDTGEASVLGFCSKHVALRNSGLICRSDSNSEDLPEFAGAGLFDSHTVFPNRTEFPRYSEDKLVTDAGFRNRILLKLKEVGVLVENCFEGVAQDIEGVLVGDSIVVVQSRPQV